MEEAFDVVLAHGWQDEWADIGETDLAAVGVAGEHDVDEGEAVVEDDVFNVVGLMAHEDYRCVGARGDGEVEIGGAGAGVVCAAEPEDVAAALEGEVAVDEDGGAVGFERADDLVGTDVDVVVAEDAETLRGLEGGEDFSGDAGGAPGDFEGEGTAADEVSGDENEIGFEGVDLSDHFFEERGLGVLLKVDVAHLDDAEVLEAVGEITDGEGKAGDLELVAAVGSSIGGQAESKDGGCSAEKAAASEVVRFDWVVGSRTTMHTQ